MQSLSQQWGRPGISYSSPGERICDDLKGGGFSRRLCNERIELLMRVTTFSFETQRIVEVMGKASR